LAGNLSVQGSRAAVAAAGVFTAGRQFRGTCGPGIRVGAEKSGSFSALES